MRALYAVMFVFTLLCSNAIIPAGADGIDSPSTTYTTSKSLESTITGQDDLYDGSNSTDLRLTASSYNCFGAYAKITYQLFLQSLRNQNLSVTHYSQTVEDFPNGWSTLTGLEMWINVTDSSGSRKAWNSSTPDNQGSPTLTTTNLGTVTPFANSSIELTIGIKHDIPSNGQSDCSATLEVYEIWSEQQLTAPEINYSANSFSFVKGVPIQTIVPVNEGGEVSFWSIHPEPPNGLQFSSTTGAVTGSPSILSLPELYTINATNSNSSDTVSITIAVVDLAPEFTYESTTLVFNQGIDIGLITPTSSGGDITSWSIDCQLPIGIEFNDTNGRLSGTAIALSSTSCVISAENSGGMANLSISIEVILAPPSLVEDTTSHTFVVDQSSFSVTISNNGGAVTSWESLDTLPSGLQFSNGVISGTPLGKSELSQYRFKATNEAGTDTISLLIQVVHPSPIFNYSQEQYTFTTGQEISSINPQLTQGISTEWTISPQLPAGLEFNLNSGVISGTPAVESVSTSYTVSAANDQGNWQEAISISVIKNQVNNGDNGNDENSPNQLSKDTKSDDTENNRLLYVVLGLFLIFGIFLWESRRNKEEPEDEDLDNTPVTTVIVHGDYIDASGGSKVNTGSGKQTDADNSVVNVDNSVVNEIKNDFNIIEYGQIDNAKPLDTLAKCIIDNINKETKIDSDILLPDEELNFSEKTWISIKILAARAYPTDGDLKISKNKAQKIFEDALRDLLNGPIMGINLIPAIGVFKDNKGEAWDESYTLEIKSSANSVLENNNLEEYIKSIRKFIHTVCTKFAQNSVLFLVDGESGEQGDLVNIQNAAEEEIVETYQNISSKYGYINTEDLEQMVTKVREDMEIESREEE